MNWFHGIFFQKMVAANFRNFHAAQQTMLQDVSYVRHHGFLPFIWRHCLFLLYG